MKVSLFKAGKKGKRGTALGEVEVADGTVASVAAAVVAKGRSGALGTQFKALSPDRVRLTIEDANAKRGVTVLKTESTLKEYGLDSGAAILVKDLGPQIGYSTVFFWEYFGPMVIYPLFFLFPTLFYGAEVEHGLAQKLACGYWVFHYAKRIFETFFVHTFSHGTMPIRNLYKNCSYYWLFAAAVSYFVNHPLFTSPPETRVLFGIVFGMLCQASNLYCHVILTNLRKPGEKGYKIPKGFLFEYITCANYSAEIYGWLGFNIATQSVMGVLFMLAGAFQMTIWALAKHKRLKTIFNGKDGNEKYPKRWVILPFMV